MTSRLFSTLKFSSLFLWFLSETPMTHHYLAGIESGSLPLITLNTPHLWEVTVSMSCDVKYRWSERRACKSGTSCNPSWFYDTTGITCIYFEKWFHCWIAEVFHPCTLCVWFGSMNLHLFYNPKCIFGFFFHHSYVLWQIFITLLLRQLWKALQPSWSTFSILKQFLSSF